MPIGLIQSTEDLVPVRLNGNSAWEFEEKIGYCISGIELNKNGDGKAEGLKHGVFQLRFAMPVLLKNAFEHVLESNWSDGRSIELLCPILVTTSEIRLIKPDLNLDDFTYAGDLNDITEVREAIILNERPGPQLQEFADSLAEEFVKNHPQLAKRLTELDNVLNGKEWENRTAPDIDTIKRSFGYSTERILVVNYNAFERITEELESSIKKDLDSEKVYGKVVSTQDGYSIKSIEGLN
jgi:acyl carrier protein phosphodiesterase